MARKPKDDFEDDGRTIVPMNVEGMPWYTKNTRDPYAEGSSGAEKPSMSREERRGYIWAALKASLLIGAAFAAAYGLFLLFCTQIWFK